MKTINQLLDLALETPGPRSKKLRRIIARLHDQKIISGGLARVENTTDILKTIETEKAKNRIPEFETA